MAGDAAAKGLITDFGTSLAFCTRLPLVHSALGDGTGIARASWAFPLVGAAVGAFGALVYWLADWALSRSHSRRHSRRGRHAAHHRRPA